MGTRSKQSLGSGRNVDRNVERNKNAPSAPKRVAARRPSPAAPPARRPRGWRGGPRRPTGRGPGSRADIGFRLRTRLGWRRNGAKTVLSGAFALVITRRDIAAGGSSRGEAAVSVHERREREAEGSVREPLRALRLGNAHRETEGLRVRVDPQLLEPWGSEQRQRGVRNARVYRHLRRGGKGARGREVCGGCLRHETGWVVCGEIFVSGEHAEAERAGGQRHADACAKAQRGT